MLAAVPADESPAGGTRPVAAAVIPGDGKGDRPVESPGVKAFVGWAECLVRSAREASNSTGRSDERTSVASKSPSHLKRMVGEVGVSSRSSLGEDQRRRRRNWVQAVDGLPGVVEGGMSRRNGQRKHGTARGSPRRNRTAKASRISRKAVKSRRACEWGGWGRISVEGPGQHNPDRSEGPWGRVADAARTAVLKRAGCSDTVRRVQRRHEEYEGRRQTVRRHAHAPHGKAPSEKPALKPYWGKPAVRNFREGDGNVGIIRSPVRAIAPPDRPTPAPSHARARATAAAKRWQGDVQAGYRAAKAMPRESGYSGVPTP